MFIEEHGFRTGSAFEQFNEIPDDPSEFDNFIARNRQKIEPWLAAVFQAEHLNLLLGSGFTTSISYVAGCAATGMETTKSTSKYSDQIMAHAKSSAEKMGRGDPNIEDQLRTAIALWEGLRIIDPDEAEKLKSDLDQWIESFLKSLLATERGIKDASDPTAKSLLQSFLLSFASRAASRERLNVFTTNYDRLIEYGADMVGLRIIDRFVGTITPQFRNSRIELDYHYNPPGIRGEPRFMEGVLRLTKLHGSLDWRFDESERHITRTDLPFGASDDHPSIPKSAVETVMIYPNAAKDVETNNYPYAELFRDFASAVCRPNSALVTYGYGFGDDHINRVIRDMLSVPSAHLVVITYAIDDRTRKFLASLNSAQLTVLAGSHFANIQHLVDDYLPKPALDFISNRMAELLKNRPSAAGPETVAQEIDDNGTGQ